MRAIKFCLGLLIMSSMPAKAWGPDEGYIKPYGQVYRHSIVKKKVRRPYVNRASGIVKSRSGAIAKVNPHYAKSFQCLVNLLEEEGYRIDKMGGYRNTLIEGTNIRSKHAFGNAIDINQCGRNCVTRKLPPNTTALARKCGLKHGKEWSDPDQGHFEVPGSSGWTEEQSTTEYASMGPLKIVKPEPIDNTARNKIFERDENFNYLCTVYNREPTKKDSGGDFTWKDIAAAQKKKMTTCEYVIGGMSERLKSALTRLGRKLDDKGIRWSILSGFRDDYRQKIATGFKASTCRSWHGGSCITQGYGDGKAVDVTIVGDFENGPRRAGDIFAKYAPSFGLTRPMPGRDPAHVQLANLSPSKHYAKRKKKRYYASR